MPDTTDDPYLKRGQEIISSKPQSDAQTPSYSGTVTTSAPDPYIARGQQITKPIQTQEPQSNIAGTYNIYDPSGNWVGQTTDPSLSKPGETLKPAPNVSGGTRGVPTGAAVPYAISPTPFAATPRGIARNVAAAGPDVGANVLNVLSDPFGNLVGKPLLTAGGFLYDLAAPYLGAKRLTPEERADLLGQTPEQQQPGTRLVQGIGRAIGVDPNQVEGTPLERGIRAAVGGAGTVAALGPGGIAPAIAGAGGGVGGFVAGQNVPEWAQPAAELGGNILGAGLVGTTTAAERSLRGAAAGGVSQADAALADLAINKYKIPLGARDVNPSYGMLSSERLPFAGGAAAAERKQSTWQGAINQQLGDAQPSTTFDPATMTRNMSRIGQVFDDVANRTTIDQASTHTLMQDLLNIENDLPKIPMGKSQRTALQKQIDDLFDNIGRHGDTIPGANYQAITSRGAPLSVTEGSKNPIVSTIAGRIRDALDDAFSRSASPADQTALSQAKYQYRLLRTIERAVDPSTGNVSPDAFSRAVADASRRFDPVSLGMKYTGGGPPGELANIGRRFVRPAEAPLGTPLTTAAAGLAGMAIPGMVHPGLMAIEPAALAANALLAAHSRMPAVGRAVTRTALRARPLGSAYPLAPSIISGTSPNPFASVPPQ